MAELAGWDRARLSGASPVDIEAARWMVYARVMAPAIQRPIADELEVMRIEAIDNPRSQRTAVRNLQAKRRRELLGELSAQKAYRGLLHLDGDDDDGDEDLETESDLEVDW